jgi:hypothetical protein
MIIRYALRPRDLKYAALRIIPEKNFYIVVSVVGILGSHIATRFKNDKSAVTAYTARKRFCGRIGKLTDKRINLSPHGETDRKQSYNC